MLYNSRPLKLCYLIALLFCFNCGTTKNGGNQNPNLSSSTTNQNQKTKFKDSLKTTIFQIDLSRPAENSIMTNKYSKKFVFNSKEPLQIELINGNPFKYTYSLNYNKINLFFDKTLIPDYSNISTQQISSENANAKFGKDLDIKDENDINNAQDKLLAELKLTSIELINFSSSLQLMDKLGFDEIIKKRDSFNEKYFKQYIGYISILEKIIELNIKPNQITSSKNDEIKSLLGGIQEKLILLLSVETNNFLLPIDVNGDNIDYVEITLQRTNINTSVVETYTYKIWIKGGLKIDFSGGAFITSLFDTDYILTNSVDEMGNPNGMQTITKQDTGDYDFGFGTLVNITPRTGSWIKPTFNVGALFTTNQKFQLLTGIGMILGKNERFIIHGGLTMGQTSELKNTFKADGTTQYQLNNNVPVADKFNFGHFFGITYNFSKPKSQEDNK